MVRLSRVMGDIWVLVVMNITTPPS